MSAPKSIRRSGFRNLPPSADSVTSSVTVQPAGDALPRVGSFVAVKTFCGVEVRARVTAVEPVASDWMAWGEILQGSEAALRAAGVPPGNDPLRIFSWQILRN
jgi:hypothetical protein